MPSRDLAADDRAVHPLVVGVFLVVVVVVFTATAYAWSSVFTDDGEDPPRASASADAHGVDGHETWIEVFLAKTETPLPAEDVSVSVTGPEGERASIVCTSPSLAAEAPAQTCRDPFAAGQTWSRANALWVPCQAEGPHDVTVSVQGVPLLATLVDCGAPATVPAAGAG